MDTYDAVIIMGSGFSHPESPVLDTSGKSRMDKALKLFQKGIATNILITGYARHPKTLESFHDRVGTFLSVYVDREERDRIYTSPGYRYSKTTRGNILAAADVIYEQGWKRVLVCTEKPHYIFRVRELSEKLIPKVRVDFTESRRASLLYWIKEILYFPIRKLSKDNEKIEDGLRNLWKKISPKFGYFVSR